MQTGYESERALSSVCTLWREKSVAPGTQPRFCSSPKTKATTLRDLHGFETWYVIIEEENVLRALRIKTLRILFGQKRRGAMELICR